MTKIQELEKQKNNAYWERNQLVAALSKIFPAHLAKHDINDKEWEDDWRTIVVIEIPMKVRDRMYKYDPDGNQRVIDVNEPKMVQLTWHIHDSEISLFDHLYYQNYDWDGHTTEEKYKRLRKLDTKALLNIFRDLHERS